MTSYRIQADDFNLDATLDSGQVFGFAKTEGAWTGSVSGLDVRFTERPGEIAVEEARRRGVFWRAYFDLDRDLAPVYAALEADERLAPCLTFRGLRLVRQDSWEALAGFILSSNNNVKRIQLIWSNLSRRLGEPTSAGFAFPRAEKIARAHERLLRELGLGYRAPFLSRTAQFVASNPRCLEHIREADYGQARERILAFPGIGEKVADCVLLYGFQRYAAFPVDTWIARVMGALYFRSRRVPETRIRAYAARKWGGIAGYVQQYIFHSARRGLLKTS